MFNLMLVCLYVNNKHQSVVVLDLLHGRLSGQGELDDGIMVQLVSAWSAFPRVLGLPPQTQGFGPVEGRGSPDLLLLLAVDSLQHSLLGFQGLRFGLSLCRDSCRNI